MVCQHIRREVVTELLVDTAALIAICVLIVAFAVPIAVILFYVLKGLSELLWAGALGRL